MRKKIGQAQGKRYAWIKKRSNYYAFGMLQPGRSYNSTDYSYGFNGQEKDDEISGSGNTYTAEYWQYDSRLGRRWNQDPKPNPSISNYACFANNPILIIDIKGDTTYRFDMKGKYVGMADLDVKGIFGSRGEMKTYKGEDGKEVQAWESAQNFTFNDPAQDRAQLNEMVVGEQKLQVISDQQLNGIMLKSDISSSNIFSRWWTAATESGSARDLGSGGNMDFGTSYLGGTPGGGDADKFGGFFIFENQSKAYNAMDAGNFMWGNAMKRLGFDYSTAKGASQANEWFQDAAGDQRAIKSGFHYKVKTSAAAKFKLTNE